MNSNSLISRHNMTDELWLNMPQYDCDLSQNPDLYQTTVEYIKVNKLFEKNQ